MGEEVLVRTQATPTLCGIGDESQSLSQASHISSSVSSYLIVFMWNQRN